MIRLLTAVGFAAITLAASVSAAPITYRFTVTATDGVLTGATATGSFTYDSSVVAPNSTVIALDLLTQLDFTWDGVAYNATTANTGDLIFDSVGALYGVLFGNNCTLVGCGAGQGNEEWFLSLPPGGTPFFIYSTAGVFETGHGIVLITGPVVTSAGGAVAAVPALSHPVMLALLSLGLVATVALRRSVFS